MSYPDPGYDLTGLDFPPTQSFIDLKIQGDVYALLKVFQLADRPMTDYLQLRVDLNVSCVCPYHIAIHPQVR